MTRGAIEELLARQKDAFARRDVEALTALHAPEGKFESPAYGVIVGRDAIRDIYRYWYAAFPDFLLTWDYALIDPPRSSYFWRFHGTAAGPFDLADATPIRAGDHDLVEAHLHLPLGRLQRRAARQAGTGTGRVEGEVAGHLPCRFGARQCRRGRQRLIRHHARLLHQVRGVLGQDSVAEAQLLHPRHQRGGGTLETDLPGQLADPAGGAASEARLDLERAMATLPERTRRLIDRVKLQGGSIAEAAQAAGMTETAAKVAIHRGLQAMARFLSLHCIKMRTPRFCVSSKKLA